MDVNSRQEICRVLCISLCPQSVEGSFLILTNLVREEVPMIESHSERHLGLSICFSLQCVVLCVLVMSNIIGKYILK